MWYIGGVLFVWALFGIRAGTEQGDSAGLLMFMGILAGLLWPVVLFCLIFMTIGRILRRG